MKRFRLSTLMLLVVVVGLILALFLQARRAERREAESTAYIQRLTNLITVLTRERSKLRMEKDASDREIVELNRSLDEARKNERR